MGGKITHCVKSPHSIILRTAAVATSGKSSAPQRKFSFDSSEVLSQRVELSHSHNTTMSSSNDGGSGSGSDARSALEQVFVLCETGILSTVQFIVNTVPEVEDALNDTHECCIADVAMSLTPLQLAAAGGHEDIVCFLLRFPAVAPNAADPTYGITALHLAVYLNHSVVVETLCKDPRVDPLQRNLDGKSSLQLAVERGNTSAVETMFRLKPNLDFSRTDFDGNTILHALALTPNKQMLVLLLHHINNSILKQTAEQLHSEQCSSPYLNRLSSMKHKHHFFAVSNYQGQTAIDLLINSMLLLQNEDPSPPIFEKLDGEITSLAADQSERVIDGNRHFQGRRFQLPAIQRHSMLQQIEECLRLMHHEINSSSSSETLTTLDVSSDDTLASQLNVSALSWSPRNESLFQKNTFEDARESPLSLYID